MSTIDNIKFTFRNGTSLNKLIFINLGVFIVLKLFLIFLLLFNISGSFILSYFAVPASLTQLLYRAWTPITYMFLHEGFLHLFFNMLSLFWFGKIFLMYFSEKQLIGLYLFGGLVAALFYVAAFNIFPFYAPLIHNSLLLGASGSIMAIILATAFQSPNMELQLMFLGSVKLKYIAIVAVLTSFFGITSSNGGGQLAHLGGALAGYFFVVSLRRGTDLTQVFNKIITTVEYWFKPQKLRAKPNKTKSTVRMSDAEYNENKARKMARIDHILDKIKTSGYESLSADEKKQLFDQGNKN
jgi:membrane associated rhomboid family serine protease